LAAAAGWLFQNADIPKAPKSPRKKDRPTPQVMADDQMEEGIFECSMNFLIVLDSGEEEGPTMQRGDDDDDVMEQTMLRRSGKSEMIEDMDQESIDFGSPPGNKERGI
jgi:hypothetical protein